MYRLEVRGLDRVLRGSSQLKEQLKGAGFRVMVRVANRAVTDVKGQLYPGHGLRTGTLRRSIHMKPDHVKQEVRVGTNIVYAPHVEFGSRRGRFKGYHMFENTFRKLPEMVEEEAREALRELGQEWSAGVELP